MASLTIVQQEVRWALDAPKAVKINDKGSGPWLTGGWRMRQASRQQSSTGAALSEGPITLIAGHDCTTTWRLSTFIFGADF